LEIEISRNWLGVVEEEEGDGLTENLEGSMILNYNVTYLVNGLTAAHALKYQCHWV